MLVTMGVKESIIYPWLQEFLEAREKNKRKEEKEESSPYHTLFQVHHHQTPNKQNSSEPVAGLFGL